MKETGLIFNTEMVRAILDGKKTQTRRPIDPQPKEGTSDFTLCRPLNGCFGKQNDGKFGLMFKAPKREWLDDKRPFHDFIRCPYGGPGDRIWVRETWTLGAKGRLYKADGVDLSSALSVRWRASIHMPRRASRIVLEITDVRVERVQKIHGKDIVAEGISPDAYWNKKIKSVPIKQWEALWNCLYNNFDLNPLVWVISFKMKERA